MKMKLHLEALEDRRTLSSWSVEVLDTKNLVSPQVENQMAAAAHLVMWDLYRHLEWKGTLDLRIDVQPNDPRGPDGMAYSILQVMAGNKNATIYEMRTGIDPMPNNPDLGMTIQVGRDGTVKFLGMKAYFDPNPAPFIPANVPSGYVDFIGVLNHEIGHSLGFNGTAEFTRYVTTDRNGYRYFNGPETVKLLGQPLPLTTMGSTHYGNYKLPNNPVTTGLMNEWGHYDGNRLDWGKLDFAVLRDVGLGPNLLDGLPITDKIDRIMPRLAVSGSSVKENMPAGTFVTTVSTNYGSTNYTFRLCPVGDVGSFRIVGNTLVTTKSFNYNSRNIYQIYVSMIDKDGVRTDSQFNIRITRNPVSVNVAIMSVAAEPIYVGSNPKFRRAS